MESDAGNSENCVFELEEEISSSKDDCSSLLDSDNESNNGIKPYQFEPYLSDTDANETNEETDTDSNSDSDNIPQDIQRIGNTEW